MTQDTSQMEMALDLKAKQSIGSMVGWNPVHSPLLVNFVVQKCQEQILYHWAAVNCVKLGSKEEQVGTISQ